MASVIIVIPKATSPAKHKQTQQFFEIMDKYLTSQGWLMFDNFPRTYFLLKNLAPTKVREQVNTIKSTTGYREAIKTIFYAPSLQKV